MALVDDEKSAVDLPTLLAYAPPEGERVVTIPSLHINDVESAPINYADEQKSEYKHAWLGTISRELLGLAHANTYSLADVPEGRKAVGSKRVVSWKTDKKGFVTKAKARLVGKGCGQEEGLAFSKRSPPHQPLLRSDLRLPLRVGVA